MNVVEVIATAWEDIATVTEPSTNSIIEYNSQEDGWVASEGDSYEARGVVDGCFNGVHTGPRECSRILALVMKRVEVNIHELTDIWNELCSPWMHKAMHYPKMRLSYVRQEKCPESTFDGSI